MAEQEKDHDKIKCSPKPDTTERMVDIEEENKELGSLREELANLGRESEPAFSQEISPNQQANLKVFKKQYTTFKEHYSVFIDKLQADVERKKVQISKLDQQKQATEQENRDLQRRLDIKENEIKKMQKELNEKQDHLEEMRHKNIALEVQVEELQNQLQEKGDQHSEMRYKNSALEGKIEEMQKQFQEKGDQLSEMRHRNTALEEKVENMQKQSQEKEDMTKIIIEKDKVIKEYHEKLSQLQTLQAKTATQTEIMGEQIKALKQAQEILRRKNESLIEESQKWLNLCKEIKPGNPQGEDTERNKQIELLTSATPLIKPEIAIADHGKDSIANISAQTLDGTTGVEAPNNVKITLVKGDIVDQTADVKVVATTSNLSLETGAVRALLNAGGKNLEYDCIKQNRDSRCDDLITVVNGGQSVQCSEIYLTRLPVWNGRDESDIQKAMTSSLKLADAQRYKSILFTAIGTGTVLNYPKDKVALEMYQSVFAYAEEHAGTLKDIGFVMNDLDTTSAFEAEERFRKKSTKPAYVSGIGQIKFQIVSGDILEQRANAIICVVDSDFRGRVAQTFKQQYPEVAKTIRSRQRELEREGLTVMKNSRLPARMLIIVTFKGVPLRWRRILACLEKANEEGCHSVSCSLHGEEQTSSTAFDTEEITSSLFTAVEEFSQKYQDSNIKCINYVLPECDEDKLTAVVELLQCMILRAEKRKCNEKGQIVGILLSKKMCSRMRCTYLKEHL